MMMTRNAAEEADLKSRIAREARRLHEEFAGTFTPETINRFMEESVAGLDRARVKDFIPMFARRFARERLHALAQVEGIVTKEVPEVLYVCVHNAGRSQMAAALTAWLGGDRVHVRSAGSDPGDDINPAVIETMAELGLDLSNEFPKPLTDEVVRAADAVVTMGCGDACPIYPGKRYLDWELDDPAGRSVEDVRRIRDEIRGRVVQLLGDLGVSIQQ